MAQNDIQRLELAIRSLSKQDGPQNSVGGCGSVFIDDTATHVGPFTAIFCTDERTSEVNNTGTSSDIDGFDTNIIIGAGATIYGEFKSITMASGKVIAYKKCR